MQRFLLAVLILCLGLCSAGSALAAQVVDVQHDLTRLSLAQQNVSGDGVTDNSAVLQAAIDKLKDEPGGATLVFGPGVYRVNNLKVYPGIRIVGSSREETIFRAAGSDMLFDMIGGELHNFTAYGSFTQQDTDNWNPGKGGVGKGGTARAIHVIRVGNVAENTMAPNVIISNVTATEARYDCLYVRGSRGLRVLNSTFDRAGRNIVSLVGNDEDFIFNNCHFGSLWGLYHVDIEPNAGRFVRDGSFINCTFDGTQAGEMGTDTWGAMLIFCGMPDLKTRNVSVIGSRFLEIAVRVRGVFPEAQFLYNPEVGGRSRVFVKMRSNKVGELRDAVLRGNRFAKKDQLLDQLSYGVTFTGNTRSENNTPAKFNNIKIDEASNDGSWKEDHPVVQQAPKKGAQPVVSAVTVTGMAKTITLPLMGHRYRFSDGAILKHQEDGLADIALHLDPVLAEGNARITRLGKGKLEDFISQTTEPAEQVIWGVQQGQVLQFKTNTGSMLLLEVTDMQAKEITFRYYELPKAASKPAKAG